jgi:hypothetical protein
MSYAGGMSETRKLTTSLWPTLIEEADCSVRVGLIFDPRWSVRKPRAGAMIDNVTGLTQRNRIHEIYEAMCKTGGAGAMNVIRTTGRVIGNY